LARFPLGLGLVLTECMAATRPSSAIRVGSPDSSWRWETKNFAEFARTVHAHRAAEDFADRIRLACPVRPTTCYPISAARFARMGTINPESKRVHLELTEMESIADVSVSVTSPENFRIRNSLIHFQWGLRGSDVPLSFYLGKLSTFEIGMRQASGPLMVVTACSMVNLQGPSVAAALYRSQEQNRLETWQAAPSHWAASQVMGGGW
jgi:hypothetical protein